MVTDCDGGECGGEVPVKKGSFVWKAIGYALTASAALMGFVVVPIDALNLVRPFAPEHPFRAINYAPVGGWIMGGIAIIVFFVIAKRPPSALKAIVVGSIWLAAFTSAVTCWDKEQEFLGHRTKWEGSCSIPDDAGGASIVQGSDGHIVATFQCGDRHVIDYKAERVVNVLVHHSATPIRCKVLVSGSAECRAEDLASQN